MDVDKLFAEATKHCSWDDPEWEGISPDFADQAYDIGTGDGRISLARELIEAHFPDRVSAMKEAIEASGG